MTEDTREVIALALMYLVAALFAVALGLVLREIKPVNIPTEYHNSQV